MSETAAAALAALIDSPPRPEAASAIASAVAAAYARVPGIGPRDVRAGSRMVIVLEQLGEAGAGELLRLRDTVRYQNARGAIEKALGRLAAAVGTPLGELQDAFAGLELDSDLRTFVSVGRHKAIIGVTPDLRRVQTNWLDDSGRVASRRPNGVTGYADDLVAVEDVRRRLRAHVTALRDRLEQAMIDGRPSTASDWTARMFGDPLRSAMTRRLIWRVESDRHVLVLPTADGLRDVNGARVAISPRDNVVLWHPADDPEAQASWTDLLERLGITQLIAQARRDVVLTESDSPRLSIASGARGAQTSFRCFLRRRGWEVPFMGRWYFIPETTRQVTRHGPIAVLGVDLDWESEEIGEIVLVGDISFRSVLDTELDTRELPPPIVSEAARDVLGAIAASQGH